ncbi:two-component system activity regulator YycH [Fructilactobacillus sp. Tb1]|uniref:two-component system activity regulator YycH n=1 Tax=Fructilactobacillus sp. Tb1 TaxID=3422304 RepID=UPI003D28834E
MMVKLKRYLLPILLGIVVLISVVLSVSLLTNPARFSSKAHEKKATTLHTESTSRNMIDVYSPTQLIENTDTDQKLLTSASTNLVSEVFKTMQHYDYSHLEKVTQGNREKYVKLMNRPDSLMLNYNNQISSDMLAKVLHYDQFAGKGNIKRIILPINDDNHVYLLNDDNYAAYKVDVSSRKLNQIHKILDQKITKNRVELRSINGHAYIYFPNQVNMKDYGYMLQEQTQNSYLNRIIGNTTTAAVKHQKNKTIYSSQNQDLTFDNNDDVIYNNYRPSEKTKNQISALKAAYQNAVELGVPLENTKFDTYNEKEHNVNYRLYIEGFPVYSNQQLGVYTYKFINGNTQRYSFSLRDFQVPVPTDKQNTTLPSSRTLLSDLEKSKVNMKQISGIRLGYQVVPDTQNKLIVTLQPSWFIKYNNQWISYRYLDTQIGKDDSNEL